MRRTARAAGWRAWRQHAQKNGFGTSSSWRKNENQTKARRLCPANTGPNTGPESLSTGPHAGELGFYFRGCHAGASSRAVPVKPFAGARGGGPYLA